MTLRMQELATEIVRLQGELDEGITMVHRQLRVGMTKFLVRSPIASMLVAPVIYSMILPMLLIDGWASLYQAICFRAYRIPRVRRSDFIVVDRQRLAYLNWIEKLNCVYCDYGNGTIAYVREIASRTEQYWCPIKHALKITDPHHRYYHFLEFGDADGYRARLDQFREQLRTEPKPDAAPAVQP